MGWEGVLRKEPQSRSRAGPWHRTPGTHTRLPGWTPQAPTCLLLLWGIEITRDKTKGQVPRLGSRAGTSSVCLFSGVLQKWGPGLGVRGREAVREGAWETGSRDTVPGASEGFQYQTVPHEAQMDPATSREGKERAGPLGTRRPGPRTPALPPANSGERLCPSQPRFPAPSVSRDARP